MEERVSVLQLAHELGHQDAGLAIRRLLDRPDDGLGSFPVHLFDERWWLSPEDADRVRERFLL